MGGAFYHLVRLALGMAFFAAGAVKLSQPEVFAVTVEAFGILPDPVVGPLSVALPCLEIGAALLLVFEARGGLALTAGLLVLFVVVLAYALGMGLDVDCGCYGTADPQREAFGSIRRSLWRDGIMLAGAAYLYWWRARRGRCPAPGL